ncbi:hypothetical protein BDY17DRAFT_79558 [Neohortaea acidophila]|uniref:P-loop containing nucleoside triphosphate hydrolase protein n=1 Tax=Neohortaea acidophila TaxID=245834 RepID=A0A6A6Q2I7_9PEZI|nr:uncharacterized protein BDY17DRAFT_79558 [Neohortaea acidophila]KAF2486462.1 hypothetical protein BDY17DRAFT_79558 [Neohortaea acidophila]
MAASTQPIFVFDSTRLRSHLFFRYVSTHPALAPIYHPFLTSAMFGPERISLYFRHSDAREKEVRQQRADCPDTPATCRQALTDAVAQAEKEGKIPFLNEHWFDVLKVDVVLELLRGGIPLDQPSALGTNPTYLADDFFHALRPIVLIRHPAHSVRSIYESALKATQQRPGDEDFELITTNKPIRILFDYFTAQGRQPIVVDGEDILWRTEEMSKALCAKLGLDPSGLSDKWTPTSKEEIERMHPLLYMLTKNIHDSAGIERPAEKVSACTSLA